MVESEDVRTRSRDGWSGTEATVTVENIGGIDEYRLTLEPGCTVLEGRNATNRTSLLSAIADVLGGEQATLKSDAEDGRIELALGGETYTRTYARRNGGLHSEGEQYTDQRALVELFVRLHEDNPIRRGVERGDDLRELLMRPVDTRQIEREIRSLEGERAEVEDRLQEIERERERLPALDDRRTALAEDLEAVESEVENLRSRVDAHEAEEAEAEQAEALVEELDDLRDRLRETETTLANREDELDRLREEREEVAAELEDSSVPDGELESVEDHLRDLRREVRSLEDRIDGLERIVSFNEDLLADEGPEPLPNGGGDVTAELDPLSKTVECWTCGSEVERREIDGRLDELRAVVDERRERRRDLESEIADLEAERRELSRAVDARADRERRLDDLDRQIELQAEEVADLGAEREEIRADIAAVEERVEETDALRESDLVEEYQRLSEREYERGRLEQELNDLTEEIEAIESLAEEADQLEAQRAELRAEIESLRSRIDDLEGEAVDQFNDHMETVLGALDYENLERVWIERRVDGAGENEFELHVVRETADGAVYEDTVDTLSESEREVVGLIVALAGYLVHEVHEVVPFVLLDSLEAIDAERIAALVEYFADYAPYLIVALLPNDAAALPEEYTRIPAADLST